jgi:hypothetical protein
MSRGQQVAGLIVGLGLIGIYSWIMVGSSGTTASWAWIVLLAGVGVLIWTARAAAISRSDDRGA